MDADKFPWLWVAVAVAVAIAVAVVIWLVVAGVIGGTVTGGPVG